MNIRLLCIAASLLFTFGASAQSDTVKVDRISLIFPSKPQFEDGEPAKIYRLKLADSSANFQLAVIDLSAMGLDESTAIAMQAEPSFWDQSRSGILEQMGEEAKLIKDEFLDWNGTKVLQMQVDRPSKEGPVSRLTLRMLIVGTYMVQYGYTDRNGKADGQVRDQFLSSLTIK